MLSFALFTGVGLVLFIGCIVGIAWAVRSGQFDDLDTPAVRILVDDEPPVKPAAPSTSTEEPHA